MYIADVKQCSFSNHSFDVIHVYSHVILVISVSTTFMYQYSFAVHNHLSIYPSIYLSILIPIHDLVILLDVSIPKHFLELHMHTDYSIVIYNLYSIIENTDPN